KDRVDSRKHGLYRSPGVQQIGCKMLADRIVISSRLKHIEVMPDRVVESGKCTVVKESRLQSNISNRRSSELVAIVGIIGYVLASKVLVSGRAIEAVIGVERSNLRNSDYVVLEIAEHLVRLPGHLVALDTTSLAKEKECSFLLVLGERAALASGKPINRSVCKNQ